MLSHTRVHISTMRPTGWTVRGSGFLRKILKVLRALGVSVVPTWNAARCGPPHTQPEIPRTRVRGLGRGARIVTLTFIPAASGTTTQSIRSIIGQFAVKESSMIRHGVRRVDMVRAPYVHAWNRVDRARVGRGRWRGLEEVENREGGTVERRSCAGGQENNQCHACRTRLGR